MSKIKFPKRRPDGSFCIEVILHIVSDDPEGLLKRVRDWAIQWAKANQVWTRKWCTGEGLQNQEEELQYIQDFNQEPLPIACSTTELKIQLECKPSAQLWKDWLVSRILPDLKTSFPEIRDF